MKITVTKVIRELEKKYAFGIDRELIKDVIDVINDELVKHKNISIKK